jgi:heme-degrading monooxygenase HmoA
MYARFITSQLKPGAIDEAITIWREKVAPSLKNTKGFCGGYMTGDRHTGKGVVMTLWETETDATNMDASGQYQEAIALFAGLFSAAPTRVQLEVLVEV